MDNITVKDFIEKYNGDVTALEIRHYVPITEKRIAIEELVGRIIVEEGLTTTYDSIAKLMVFRLASICLYTNLSASTPEDYDVLMENDLLFKIYDEMNINNDFNEFCELFEMRFKDKMRNANTFTGMIDKIVNMGESFLEKFNTEEISELIKLVEGVINE